MRSGAARALDLHRIERVMRAEEDDVEPKQPRPVRFERKGANPLEIAEVAPWRLTLMDEDRDQRHHVV